MADTFTPNYNLRKCEVGADNNTWGGFTNGNWDLVDSTFFAQFGLKLSLAGGSMTGALNTQDVIPIDNSNRKLGSTTKVFSDVFVQQIDFYTVATPPTLNGTLSSSGAGFSLKAAGATQTFQYLDPSNNVMVSFNANGTIIFGTVAHQCNLTFNGGATFTGNVAGQNFTATSDERLKHNVTDIDDALTKVLALRGVEFDWNDEQQGHALGVLAQELQGVIPSAVKPLVGRYLGVEYNQIIPLLIEGIRVLSERVTALEGRNQ